MLNLDIEIAWKAYSRSIALQPMKLNLVKLFAFCIDFRVDYISQTWRDVWLRS